LNNKQFTITDIFHCSIAINTYGVVMLETAIQYLGNVTVSSSNEFHYIQFHQLETGICNG